MSGDSYIRWFSEIKPQEVPFVGIKGLNISVLYQREFPVPPGFVLTSQAFFKILENNGIRNRLFDFLGNVNYSDEEAVKRASEEIKRMIKSAEFPKEIVEQIVEACEVLNTDSEQTRGASVTAMLIMKNSYELPFVSVRCSTADSFYEDASSFLNIKGINSILEAIKESYSSVFSSEIMKSSTFSEVQGRIPQTAIVIQKMINSDKSGFIYPNRNKPGEYVIDAGWGIGKAIKKNVCVPDKYRVGKEHELMNIFEIAVSDKKMAMTRDSSGRNIIVTLTNEKSNMQVLQNKEILYLAKYADNISQIFEDKQAVSFAISENEIFILSCKPYLEAPVKEEVFEEDEELPQNKIEEIWVLDNLGRHIAYLDNGNDFNKSSGKEVYLLAGNDKKNIPSLLENLKNENSILIIPNIYHSDEIYEIINNARINGFGGQRFGVKIDNPTSVQIINSICKSGINKVVIHPEELTSSYLGENYKNYDNLQIHPAVEGAISFVINNCKKNSIPVYISVQDSSFLRNVSLFLHHGVDGFIVQPHILGAASAIIDGHNEAYKEV